MNSTTVRLVPMVLLVVISHAILSPTQASPLQRARSSTNNEDIDGLSNKIAYSGDWDKQPGIQVVAVDKVNEVNQIPAPESQMSAINDFTSFIVDAVASVKQIMRTIMQVEAEATKGRVVSQSQLERPTASLRPSLVGDSQLMGYGTKAQRAKRYLRELHNYGLLADQILRDVVSSELDKFRPQPSPKSEAGNTYNANNSVPKFREKRRRCKMDPNLGVKNPSYCDTDAYFGAADYTTRDVWDSAGRR